MAEPIANKKRRAVLLLHGLCSSTLEVRLFARTLRDHDFEVVIPTLAGYSYSGTDSEVGSPAPDFRRWIRDACAEVDRLTTNFYEISICGVSLGATLALAVAAETSQKLNGLSLISTTLFFDGWNVSRWRFLLPLVYYTPLGRLYRYRETPPYGVRNERIRSWIAAQLAEGSLSLAGAATIPTASLREAGRLIYQVKRSLGNVLTPTLMIHAQQDDVASLANVHFVRRHIGAETFREVVVSDSYHMITVDNDRELAALRTVQFFHAAAQQRAAATNAVSSWAIPLAQRPRSYDRTRFQ